jgi:hypothetical protein
MKYRCKKEYVDLGFICFSNHKEYEYVETEWKIVYLIDNYDRIIGIPMDILFEYFYTLVEHKGIKRKEYINKLLNERNE